jgi:hypothetical protein
LFYDLIIPSFGFQLVGTDFMGILLKDCLFGCLTCGLAVFIEVFLMMLKVVEKKILVGVLCVGRMVFIL